MGGEEEDEIPLGVAAVTRSAASTLAESDTEAGGRVEVAEVLILARSHSNLAALWKS